MSNCARKTPGCDNVSSRRRRPSISKKSLRAPGDPPEPAAARRRRMRAAVETLAPTVGLAPACRALGVARASVYRHRKAPVPKPRALAPQERTQVLDTLREDRFVDRPPAAVYATLLEEGRYLCSIRTMYRVLHDADEVIERRRQRRHPHREPPRLMATAPNQVWTWDITRLPGPRQWVTYPLYVVLDLFSRYVVAWMVARRESANRAQRLISSACQKQGITPGQLTLHQDRGAPMTAKTFSQLLVDLDILASYSRPRVSDDTRIRRATSRRSNTRRRTRVALVAPRTHRPTFETSSPGTTPNTVTVAWGCSLPTPCTMAWPMNSRPRGSTSSTRPTAGIPSASSTANLGHQRSRAKSGSTNRTRPSNATIFVSNTSREVSHSP